MYRFIIVPVTVFNPLWLFRSICAVFTSNSSTILVSRAKYVCARQKKTGKGRWKTAENILRAVMEARDSRYGHIYNKPIIGRPTGYAEKSGKLGKRNSTVLKHFELASGRQCKEAEGEAKSRGERQSMEPYSNHHLRRLKEKEPAVVSHHCHG